MSLWAVPFNDHLGTTRAGGGRPRGVRLDRQQARFLSVTDVTPDWMADAACAGYSDYELLDQIFFSSRNSANRQRPSATHREQQARRICAFCPVRRECLVYTCSAEEEPVGTAGGVHDRERLAVRHLSLHDRVRALDAVFHQRVGEVLLKDEEPS